MAKAEKVEEKVECKDKNCSIKNCPFLTDRERKKKLKAAEKNKCDMGDQCPNLLKKRLKVSKETLVAAGTGLAIGVVVTAGVVLTVKATTVASGGNGGGESGSSTSM